MDTNTYRIQSAVCEACEKVFISNKTVYRIINMDADGTIKNDFETFKLNRVQCKYCKSYFTYEIPLFVYSLYSKYFVFTGKSLFLENKIKRILKITGNENARIFHVPYYAFALEIAIIYKYELDYDEIINIKNIHFGANSLDILKEYIIFEKYENDILYYTHLNFLNEAVKSYQFKYKEQLTNEH